jgi:expansin (peptidoglycan-binding protein)
MRADSPLSLRTLALMCILGLAACSCGSSAEDAANQLRALGEFQAGVATWYEATGGGHCGYDPSPGDMDVAAMNAPQFAGSAVCGSCAEIEGPDGKTVRVRIVDSCPECPAGHLDLSKQAFEKISPLVAGKITTRWRIVTCSVEGPVRYRIKEGSNPNWTAIQVRNHRLPVTKFEWQKGGTWVQVKREPYNYFVEPAGMGTGSVKVRVTASDGQVLEDTLPSTQPEKTFDGARNFSN